VKYHIKNQPPMTPERLADLNAFWSEQIKIIVKNALREAK